MLVAYYLLVLVPVGTPGNKNFNGHYFGVNSSFSGCPWSSDIFDGAAAVLMLSFVGVY